MIPNISTCVNHFEDQKCQVSIILMWVVLSINNSRYQHWQVSDLIWSIELSISYASLKSDNITYVEMSYVLAYPSPKVSNPPFNRPKKHLEYVCKKPLLGVHSQWPYSCNIGLRTQFICIYIRTVCSYLLYWSSLN